MSSSLPKVKTTASTEGDKTRMSDPDSGGGGYFTLSESEAGSNDDNKLLIDKDFNQSPRKFYCKMLCGLRSRSETPPRPSPPKDYHRDQTPPRPSPPKLQRRSQTPERRSITDEPLPPKPPTPLSYRSTLPPPVPKKSISKTYRYRSKTLPTRKNSIPRDKQTGKDIRQQAGSSESLLPQSNSEEFLHSSTPPQSSDEKGMKFEITEMEENVGNQTVLKPLKNGILKPKGRNSKI